MIYEIYICAMDMVYGFCFTYLGSCRNFYSNYDLGVVTSLALSHNSKTIAR